MGGHFDLLTSKWIEDKPRKKSPEAAVGNAVDAFLKLKGAYIRQITSAGTMRNGKWTRGGQGSGISDRIGILPGGRFIAVELKAPGKKPTLSQPQYDFLSKILNHGGVACVADCVDDVARALSQSPVELRETLDKFKP